MAFSEPTLPTGSNLPEFSVSEISTALKRTVEERFPLVRVRGEISQPKYHGSGHLYLTLKDDRSVLAGVCWRGTVGRLSMRAEDGLEVICTGRISTFAGQSKYQLIIEGMELAGEGALLKLLEDRRRRLAEEGLFDADRKRPLPFLPRVIGVVTSPTGAVIRDILHRLEDRFPRHVLVWPVAVQGNAAEGQVAEAITGFNALSGTPGGAPRPDLLIVARGGGSLEDLMAFNEESVVRAVAASTIPVITAVGHETDTTLVDHAADRRAPTPSAAAEMAVPVRHELAADLMDRDRRMTSAVHRLFEQNRLRVEGLSRGLGDPARLLEAASQRLDDRSERLHQAWPRFLDRRRGTLVELSARLPHPQATLNQARQSMAHLAERLAGAMRTGLTRRRDRFDTTAGRLSPAPVERLLREKQARLVALSQLLDSLSPEGPLKRGYALVRDGDAVLTSVAEAKPGRAVTLQFGDGTAGAVIGRGKRPTGAAPAEEPPDGSGSPPPRQSSLF